MRVPVEKASATQARAAFLLRSRHGGWPLTEETRIDPCGAAVYASQPAFFAFLELASNARKATHHRRVK